MSGFSGFNSAAINLAHPPSVANLVAGNTYYLGYCGIGVAEAWVNSPIAQPMTINRMYGITAVAPGAGQSQTWTLRKNGADTAITFTISDANVAASDTAHSETFAPADKIDIKIVMSGGAASTGSVMASLNAVNVLP
jgi:hypothetical protein